MKELAGTLRKDRTNFEEPSLPILEPEDMELDHLSPTARELWPQFADVLRKMGVLTEADGAALTELVETYAEIVDARRVIRAEGAYYDAQGQNGSFLKKSHPALVRISDAGRRWLSLATQFGLTPAARSKVSAAITDEPKNEFEDI